VERNLHNFLVGESEGVNPLRKIGVSGSIILKCVLRKKENLNGDWVFLFESRDKWPAVVIFVISFVVP
jgi:hypothetical protein